MSNITVTPARVYLATEKLVAILEASGIETQAFYSETGAAVLTDKATYEVYSYDARIIIQMLVSNEQGWEDVTELVK
jgi:hypothetical protein